MTMKPKDCKTEKDILKLWTDRHIIDDYHIQVCDTEGGVIVSITEDFYPQTIHIDRTAFNKLIRWYLRNQAAK